MQCPHDVGMARERILTRMAMTPVPIRERVLIGFSTVLVLGVSFLVVFEGLYLAAPLGRDGPSIALYTLIAGLYLAGLWALLVQLHHVWTARIDQRIEDVFELLQRDGLTGLLNRASFIDRIRASNIDGHVLIIDADHFKQINDAHGHYTGDAVLMRLAKTIEIAVGGAGITGRLGGEEFGVFLPGADQKAAQFVGETIRDCVAQSEIITNGLALSLTVSLGGAPHHAVDPVGAAFKLADKRLYGSKAMGRNRLTLDDDIHGQLRADIERDLSVAA